LGRIGSGLLSRIWNNGRVVATSMGVVGDSGMHSPVGFLRIIGDSREDLVKSESAYRSACTSREMLRTADCVTITDHGWFLATGLGLDNRFLLPPFLPVCRNQDGLFGLLIQTCFEYACFGHLPGTIIHSPMEDRLFKPDAMWKSAGKVRFCDVVVSAIA